MGILDSDGRGMPDWTGAADGAVMTEGFSMTTVALSSSTALAAGMTLVFTGREALGAAS